MEQLSTNSQNKQDQILKYSTPFFILTGITLLFNLILFFKSKEFYIKLILAGGIITEILILYSIIEENQEYLTILHQVFLVLSIIGCIFFDKIYLTFIIYLLLISFLTREIYGYCLFEAYEEKEANGDLTLIVIICIILVRLYIQKLHKNLLKF